MATRNAGKLRELRALLEGDGIRVIDLSGAGVDLSAEEEGIECYGTFEENALAKARYFSRRLPGRVVVADDSGLCVRALGEAPGVHSKRWSGAALEGPALDAANNAKLMAALEGKPDRRARFVCAAAWASGGCEVVALGEVAGEIVASSGGTHGFGYDPHFLAHELGMTLAQATVAEKQRVSHRGRAFASLLGRLREDGRVV